METPGSLPGKPLSFFCALLLCAAALAFMVNTVWDYIGSPKLISVLCNHVWIPADCTTPETCSKCGETRGEAEGHTWLEATCTLMKRCEVCDAAMGTPLGHKWQDATYDAPKTCQVCGATEGEPLAKPTVAVNDIVAFGKYEQDGMRSNGSEAIEWLVLDVQEDKALLLSLYALDSMPYHNSYKAVTWEASALRNWLNGSFLDTAFTADEQADILTTELNNGISQSNREWAVSGGNNTEDMVFLLSYADTDRYFDDAADRICVPTQYAVNMGADTRILDDGVTTAAWWWLRSPGESSNQASFVNFDGTRYTNAVGNTYLSVRPALWIRLDSE